MCQSPDINIVNSFLMVVGADQFLIVHDYKFPINAATMHVMKMHKRGYQKPSYNDANFNI